MGAAPPPASPGVSGPLACGARVPGFTASMTFSQAQKQRHEHSVYKTAWILSENMMSMMQS